MDWLTACSAGLNWLELVGWLLQQLLQSSQQPLPMGVQYMRLSRRLVHLDLWAVPPNGWADQPSQFRPSERGVN